MAKRYSGDVEVRITCRPFKGWNGRRRLFYFARISAPRHRGEGVLSPEECGVRKGEDPRSPESYDKAARAFIAMAHQHSGIGRFCNFVDGGRGRSQGGELEILRVQQAPCPVGMVGSPRRLTRKRRRART